MKRYIIAVSLAIFLGLLFYSLATLLTNNLSISSGSAFFYFKNESKQTLSPVVRFYVRDVQNYDNIKFFNVTITPISRNTTLNPFYVAKIPDGSGVTLYVKNSTPQNEVIFRVDNIKVTSNTPLNLSSIRIEANPIQETIRSDQMKYDIVFSIFGGNFLIHSSLASAHSFSEIIREDIVSHFRFDRIHVLEYVWVSCFVLFILSLSVPFLIMFPTSTIRRYPFVTLTFVSVTTSLYAFIGSGYELYYFLSPPWFFPLSIFLHGYDQHITGNLFYFIPLSLLMESWLRLRSGWKNFLIWFAIPMFASNVVPGIGLSLSIESMTWALWARIVKEKDKLRTKLDTLLTIFSGIPSLVFLGWTYQILFSRSSNPYYQRLELKHVTYGVATLGAVIVISVLIYRKAISEYIPKIFRKKLD